MQARQNSCVDLVGLDMRMGERPEPEADWRRRRVSRRAREPAPRPSCCRSSRPRPHRLLAGSCQTLPTPCASCRRAGAPQLPLFADDYFREGTVYVRSHASDPSPSLQSTGAWATRQLRIRARSATGRVEEAANYKHELSLNRTQRLARTWCSRRLYPGWSHLMPGPPGSQPDKRRRNLHTGYKRV
jgi:hypothetical protein